MKVNGEEFRNGRIDAGTQGERSMHPEVIKFLEAQGAQGPVLWLELPGSSSGMSTRPFHGCLPR